MSRVLVTDGDQRSALATVRSLRRAGHVPFVCSVARRSLAAASRYSAGSAEVADPLTRPEEFVADVRSLVHRWSVDVLLPAAEPSVLALLAARESFGAVSLPYPSLQVFHRVCDKRLVLAAAAELGIRTPRQVVIAQPGHTAGPAVHALGFPLVIKPSRSIGEAADERRALRVQYAGDPRSLESTLQSLPPQAYPVLLQERIVGEGMAASLLLSEGELLAAFVHRRLREKPPSGGVSVFCESIQPRSDLVEPSYSLLKKLGWTGLAMVEYKIQASTGLAYLMEINGRFWGSIQLAIDSGVDFPALLLATTAGERPPRVSTYRTGVRSHWWWGEVDHVIARLRGAGEPPTEQGSPGPVRELMRSTSWRDRDLVFRWKDPLPFALETVRWLIATWSGTRAAIRERAAARRATSAATGTSHARSHDAALERR